MKEQTRATMGKTGQQNVSDGCMASRTAESINSNHYRELKCLEASDGRVTCDSFRDRYCMLDWIGGPAKPSLANRTEARNGSGAGRATYNSSTGPPEGVQQKVQ